MDRAVGILARLGRPHLEHWHTVAEELLARSEKVRCRGQAKASPRHDVAELACILPAEAAGGAGDPGGFPVGVRRRLAQGMHVKVDG